MRNNIVEFRKKLNINQRQLAKIINSPYQLIQKYEYGSSVPSVETAIRLARALNTTVECLFVLDD